MDCQFLENARRLLQRHKKFAEKINDFVILSKFDIFNDISTDPCTIFCTIT